MNVTGSRHAESIVCLQSVNISIWSFNIANASFDACLIAVFNKNCLLHDEQDEKIADSSSNNIFHDSRTVWEKKIVQWKTPIS